MKKYCSQPVAKPRKFAPSVTTGRKNFILSVGTKWTNGTELTFAFIGGANPQRNVVRQAFKIWKGLGIGISFKEVSSPSSALIRISFDRSEESSWSYVGRESLTIPKNQPTMNFGWSLTANAYGMTTALHEIGHAIGFQHEHQSPFAGIEWNVPAVYQSFMAPPNNWSKRTIQLNILNKLSPNQVKGSNWDPKSIMQYEFDAGLISKPTQYKNGIFPPGILSKSDVAGVKQFYPLQTPAGNKKLASGQTAAIKPVSGSQTDFVFKAPLTAKYLFETTGDLDTVMVVSEKSGKELYYMAGDDDSGTEKNAQITLPLVKGRTYIANIRVMYAPEGKAGDLTVKQV